MPRVRHALRLGSTVGISFFWSNVKTYIPFRDTIEEWPDRLDTILTSHDVTDIVLYGDTRQIHAEAITTVEGILHRLETDGLPHPAPFYRLLSKVQGLFASADPFWR